MPKKYFTVEYTTEQLWGVSVEAATRDEAKKEFNNGNWANGPWAIGDIDSVSNIINILESEKDGGDL